MSDNYDGKKPIGAFSSLQTYLTYSWINNDLFYSLVPSTYQDYYFRFVKQWFYWYDGWVPYFHNSQSGMVSTRLAYTLMKKLAEKTIGSRVMFDDEGEVDEHDINIKGRKLNSLDFTEYWAEQNDFTPKIKTAFEYAYAGGDSLLKLDSDGKELFLKVLRKDNYLIDTDFRGNVIKYKGFIYTYTKMIKEAGSEETRKMYYVVEEREIRKGKPMFRIAIKVSNANMTNAKSMDANMENVTYERLPNDVSRKFKKDYPNMTLGVWKDMPLEDLGLYLIKATQKVSFLPDAPFGESLLSNIVHLLMTYDFYFSSLTTNLYTSRDKVILPQHMATPQDQAVNYGQNFNQGLDTFIYSRVPYTDPENQKPIFIQPELRDWVSIRNNLLQTVAMSLGVDERDVMSSVVPNSEKGTAKEISVDSNTTASFVEEKREINKNSINRLIESLLNFYGFGSEIVKVRFSRAGLNDINSVVTVATLLKQSGLGDRKSLLELVWLDKNEKQINNMIAEIEAEEEKALEQEQKKMETDVEENIEQKEHVTEHQVPKDKK